MEEVSVKINGKLKFEKHAQEATRCLMEQKPVLPRCIDLLVHALPESHRQCNNAVDKIHGLFGL